MAKLNRTCGICKTKYSYCPTCAADVHKPTWMAVFCSENCREIYNIVNDYKHEKLNKENAHQKLKVLDLSCFSKLPGNFKLIVDEILKEDQIELNISENIQEEKICALEENVIQEPSIVNEVLEAALSEEIISELDESIVEIKKPRSKRKAKIVE